MSFIIFDSPDEELRIKSFSSSTKGEKGIIRIEIECSDLGHLGFALRTLANTQKAKRAMPEKPKPEKPKALPPPKPLLLSKMEDL